MRITFISLFYPSNPDPPESYLSRFSLYRHLPQQLARRGHDVDFIQLHPHSRELTQEGVQYRFIRAGRLSRWIGTSASKLTSRPAALFEPAQRAVEAARSPDIVHFHGTQLHLNLTLLRLTFPGAALVLHYHGGSPPRLRLLRRLQQENFEAADAILFTTSELAHSFVRTSVLREPEKIFEMVETSSEFSPGPRGSQLSGNPVFLSTCRLHPIKDPWTTLFGFERVAARLPHAELHHFYRSDELLPHLRQYVDARPSLRTRVHFWGRRPYNEMESIYGSADVLLQSSTREFSGCAILDAMACGIVPVVADIPSFRKMTDAGRVGRLFDVGNPAALADSVLAITDLTTERAAVREHFERELSFRALAERAETIYQQVLSRRAG